MMLREMQRETDNVRSTMMEVGDGSGWLAGWLAVYIVDGWWLRLVVDG
jgi:hypothetical protein